MSRRLGTLVLLAASLTVPMPVSRSAPAAKPEEHTDAFGDPLPPHVVLRIGTVRFRHGAAVSALAVSPDGMRVYSVGDDKAVRAWELATGKETRHWPDDDNDNNFRRNPALLALSPDGKQLASCENLTLQVCDSSTDREPKTVAKLKTSPIFLAFIENADILVWEDSWEAPVRLLRATTGEERLSFSFEGDSESSPVQTRDGHSILRAAVSLDGSRLLTSRDGRLWLWDVAKGEKICKIGGKVGTLTAVAMSPNKKLYAWGCDGGELAVGKLSGEEVQFLSNESNWTISTLAFSPDSRRVACGDEEGKVAVYDVDTGKRLWRIDAHKWSTTCLAFTPDGKSLVTGGGDGCVQVLDAKSGDEKLPNRGNLGTVQVALSPDGSRLVTLDRNRTIRCFDSANGKELRAFPLAEEWDFNSLLTFSPDGNGLTALTLETRRSWDLETGRELRRLPYKQNMWGQQFSPDGRHALRMSSGNTLTIVSVPAWRKLWETTREESFRHLNWIYSPDGKWLGVLWFGSNPTDRDPQPEEFRIYKTATGKELQHFPLSEGENPLAFAPDKTILITEALIVEGGRDGMYRTRLSRITVDTGAKLPPFQGEQGLPETTAFSPDSKTLVMGDATGVLRLWEMATGKPRGILTGHRGPVRSLAFSADGRRLLSGSADTTALFWDMSSAACGTKPAPTDLSEKDLDALWADLRSDDAAVAYRAIAVLAAFPKQSVPYLRSRLKAVSVDPKRLIKLVADLDDANFETRQKAHAELADLAEIAEPILRETLMDPPSAEVGRRVQDLLNAAKTSPYVLTGERLRSWRALEALEECGTSEACEVLALLAKGDAWARLTREAKLALERLRKRGVAAH